MALTSISTPISDTKQKLEKVSRQGLDAIRIATAAGVQIAFGTDLLVVAGDPARDLAPPQAPEKGLLAVMKGGVFFKNRL